MPRSRASQGPAALRALSRLEQFAIHRRTVDTRTYTDLNVVTYPCARPTPTTPHFIFVHGYPGSAACGLFLPEFKQETHHVHLVDLPGHGLSKKPKHFDYRVGTQARALLEIIEALQIGERDRVELAGHSVGAEIINRALLWRMAKEMPGPRIDAVHYLAPVGQLLTEYRLHEDVDWNFILNILRRPILGRIAAFLGGGYWWGMVDTYKTLFHDFRSPDLADYRTVLESRWLSCFSLLGGWRTSRLIEGTNAEEYRMYSMGRFHYLQEVTDDVGQSLRTGEQREAFVRGMIARTGAPSTVVIPGSDKVIRPQAQHRFAEALGQITKARETWVANSGHMVVVERPAEACAALAT